MQSPYIRMLYKAGLTTSDIDLLLILKRRNGGFNNDM
jgi:hypothetical protein